MRRIGPHQDVQRPTMAGPWDESMPAAICADDSCPWKHVHPSLPTVDAKGAEHVSDSGHDVVVHYRKRLTISLAPEVVTGA